MTVAEGIRLLETLCVTEVLVGDKVQDQLVPEPLAPARKLLELAKIKLPARLPSRGVIVSTKRKLVGQRPRRSK